MRKRIKLALLPLLFSIAGWAFPQTAQAQFLGYTSPQTTTSMPFGASPTTCTGSAQNSTSNAIQNVGQSSHFAYLTSSDITSGTMVVQGSQDGISFNNISETATIAGAFANTPNSFVVGSGYYNFVRVSVNCNSGGHFIVQYSGSSVTPGALFGAQQLTQFDKTITSSANALSNFTSQIFQPPFGSSAGWLSVRYATSGGVLPTGSTISVACVLTTTSVGGFGLATNAILNATVPAPQSAALPTYAPFLIPAQGCPNLQVAYGAGTGGSGSILLTIDYLFTLPGLLPNSNSWMNITGTTATSVKISPGTLHSLTVNTAAAGTVKIFDLIPASCTGTPSTVPFAVVTVTSTSQALPPFIYDAFFQNGICIKASVAMDLTATFN